jgi:hypothetical protein
VNDLFTHITVAAPAAVIKMTISRARGRCYGTTATTMNSLELECHNLFFSFSSLSARSDMVKVPTTKHIPEICLAAVLALSRFKIKKRINIEFNEKCLLSVGCSAYLKLLGVLTHRR